MLWKYINEVLKIQDAGISLKIYFKKSSICLEYRRSVRHSVDIKWLQWIVSSSSILGLIEGQVGTLGNKKIDHVDSFSYLNCPEVYCKGNGYSEDVKIRIAKVPAW